MAPLRILIVEDECIIALDLRMRLTRLGYQIVGMATTGHQAIELAEVHRPDVALMDIGLPDGMNGIQAAAHLRAAFGIPVVYMTAYSSAATRQDAETTAPLGYLTKPVGIDLLQSVLATAFPRVEALSEISLNAA